MPLGSEVKEGDRMVVRHKGVVVADLPAKSLTDNAPVYDHQPVNRPMFWKLEIGRSIQFLN